MEAPRPILVIGTGVVGGATALTLAARGHTVVVWDRDPAAMAATGLPALDLAAPPRHWALIVIAVPTPTVGGEMWTGPLKEALDFAANQLGEGADAVVAIRSTLVPGTMDGVVRETLAGPLERGAALCYWPCFARERVAVEDEASPRVVVCGIESEAVAERVRPLLGPQGCDLRVMSFVEAELAKQAANAWNAAKISYFNALGDWAAALGGRGQVVADVVAAAAEGSWSPAYGTNVGPAYGGACLPKDLDALLAVAESRELPHAGLLRAVRAVNESPLRTGRPG